MAISKDDRVGLGRLQEILYRLIAAPEGVASGLALERALPAGGLAALIAGDDRISPVERLEIYANGFFYRLLEVLKEDYPATLAIAGADNFHNLVTGYLLAYPPTAPSLYYAGANFADYLAAHPLSARWPYLADLARLERASLESFHAADAPALDARALRAIAPARWPALPLRTHPATRLVESRWRVDELARAVTATAPAPTTIATPPPAPAAAGVAIVISRRDRHVAYRAADPGEDAALRLLLAAPPPPALAAICAAIAAGAGVSDADLPALINRLLARWLADGLLLAIES